MGKKLNEGISIQELENFGKRYFFELFFVLYFLLATLLTFLFFRAFWSVVFAGVGGILGIWFSKAIERIAKKVFRFVFKQDKTIKWVLAIVGIVVAFFLPPLVFLTLGCMGGIGICALAKESKHKLCDDNGVKEKDHEA